MNKFLWPIFIFVLIGCASLEAKGSDNPGIEVKSENLYATIDSLSSITPARNLSNPDSLTKAANIIKASFISYGYIPEEQPFKVDGKEYKNIVATIGPRDAPRLIIGAHYDVCDNQPGADDNASGVAGLLELARLLKANNPKLNYRIDFVAYTLEEPPVFRSEFMGSYIHAKSLSDNRVKLIGMVSLEMIGYFTEEKKSQNYPSLLLKLFYPSKGNFIAVVGRFGDASFIKKLKKGMKKGPVKVRTLRAPTFYPGIDFSDHMNFWKFGYNAAMVTDTAFFRNPNYHKQSDTIDTLDFEKMSGVIEGLYYAITGLKSK